MANEAELRVRYSDPIDMTVADGTGIEKGTICKMTDPLTASESDGDVDVVAGIAAREKVANDGRTRLAIFRSGIFDVYVSGSVTTGDAIVTDSSTTGANICKTADTNEEALLGTALEDHTGDAGQIQVELNPRGIKVA